MKKENEFDENSQDLEKIERISKETKRLYKLFSKMDAKIKKSVQSLVDNAAFMAITLEDLMEIINTNGVTEEYQNGANQSGVKKSSEVEVYNTMVKNHMNIMKQLTDLLPKQPPQNSEVDKDDGFEKFVQAK